MGKVLELRYTMVYGRLHSIYGVHSYPRPTQQRNSAAFWIVQIFHTLLCFTHFKVKV
jgi:hypothetical protein